MAGDSSRQADWMLAGLTPGTLVAGYRIESRIGSGGMAVVFRARDERLGRSVALKVLAPSLAGDSEFRERFIRESRAAAAVDHPHIIPVYAAGEADSVLYIAMRFVAGGDLRSVIYREGPLPADRVVSFLSPVASALDAAHAAGLVHRDVKPANILVDTGQGQPDHPYLSDFGLSKGAASSAGLTEAGQFLGTPDYSAPEQISGKPVHLQTDQYALACVAFTMLTGKLPFARAEPMMVLWAHVTDPPPRVTDRRPDLSPTVDQVLARALAKTPQNRFSSCGEFADSLRAALSRGVTAAWLSALPPSAPSLSLRPSGDNRRHEIGPPASPPWPPVSEPTTTSLTAVPHKAIARPQAPVSPPPADAPVEKVNGAADGPNEARRHALRASKRSRRKRRSAVAAFILLAAVAAGVAVLLQPTGPRHQPAATGKHQASTRLIATLTNPNSQGVNVIAFGPNETLDAIDGNSHAYVFHIAKRSITSVFAFDSSSSSGPVGAFPSRDGAMLAYISGCNRNTPPACRIIVSDIAAKRQIARLQSTTQNVSTSDISIAAVNPEGDGTEVWSLRSGTLLADLTDPDHHFVVATAVSPNGKMLATSSDSQASSHTIYVWNISSRTVATTITVPGDEGFSSPQGGTAMAFDGNGKTLALSNGTVTYFYSVATRHRISTLPAGLGALSRDGKLMLGYTHGFAGSQVQLWNIALRKPIVTITFPDSTNSLFGPTAFAINHDGSEMAVAHGIGSISVWNISGP